MSGTGSFLRSPDRMKRVWMLLIAGSIAGIAMALLLYGWDYYLLELSDRPLWEKHLSLKPSGVIGLRLGMLGFFLLAAVYLYPLRKHWSFLGRFGKTRNWFDFHVLLGLTAPVIVTFHSAFKLQGFAGMAYWMMLALVISGIIGRYFYAQIPRHINAAEMTWKEMKDLKAALLQELKRQQCFPEPEIEKLFRLPELSEVQAMPALRALIYMVALDLMRPFKIWLLRRRGMKATGRSAPLAGIVRTGNEELEKTVLLVSRQAALSKRILFLSRTQSVFYGWHIIHRPFSISIAIFVIIHVTVVIWLGYF